MGGMSCSPLLSLCTKHEYSIVVSNICYRLPCIDDMSPDDICMIETHWSVNLGQLGANLGKNMLYTQRRSECATNLGELGANLWPPGANFGPRGTILGQLGANLEPCRGQLGPYISVFHWCAQWWRRDQVGRRQGRGP
jgi:hypothetical protein